MFEDELIAIFDRYHYKLSNEQVILFKKYYDLLIEWNEKFNLTTITSQKDVIVKHFLDSVTALSFIPQGSSVLDLGCGAGFPGIPLKIMRPDIKLTLVDSVNKKIMFLDEVITSLSLGNVVAMHARAEDLAITDAFREKYDVVVSRAVANMSTLSEYCIPFVQIDGVFIAYKSKDWQLELEQSQNAIKLLGGKVCKKVEFDIENNQRCLIIVEKKSKTPQNYPRSKNKPRISPL